MTMSQLSTNSVTMMVLTVSTTLCSMMLMQVVPAIGFELEPGLHVSASKPLSTTDRNLQETCGVGSPEVDRCVGLLMFDSNLTDDENCQTIKDELGEYKTCIEDACNATCEDSPFIQQILLDFINEEFQDIFNLVCGGDNSTGTVTNFTGPEICFNYTGNGNNTGEYEYDYEYSEYEYDNSTDTNETETNSSQAPTPFFGDDDDDDDDDGPGSAAPKLGLSVLSLLLSCVAAATGSSLVN